MQQPPTFLSCAVVESAIRRSQPHSQPHQGLGVSYSRARCSLARGGWLVSAALVLLATAAITVAAATGTRRPPPDHFSYLKDVAGAYYVFVRPEAGIVDTSADAARRVSAPDESGNDGLHPMKLALKIELAGSTVNVQLRKNVNLFADDYQHFVFGDAALKSSEVGTEHCHYHGYVVEDPNSSVAVSLCDGLSGLIQFKGSFYTIEPAEPSIETAASPLQSKIPATDVLPAYSVAAPLFATPPKLNDRDHFMYRVDTATSNNKRKCGVNHGQPASAVAPPHEMLKSLGVEATATEVESRSELSSGPTKYVEVVVFNDNARFRRYGGQTERVTASIMNFIAKFYKDTSFAVNFVVVLSAQITFARGDPYQAARWGGFVDTQGGNGLLTTFQNYLARAPGIPKFDQAMLFSGERFKDGIVGLAGVSTMCGGATSSAVCQLNRASDPLDALVCAHEMGHNLGMEHDSYGNQCPPNGWIMAPYEGSAVTFSPCSVQYASRFMAASRPSCMDNVPTKAAPSSRARAKELPSNDPRADVVPAIITTGEEESATAMNEVASVAPIINIDTASSETKYLQSVWLGLVLAVCALVCGCTIGILARKYCSTSAVKPTETELTPSRKPSLSQTVVTLPPAVPITPIATPPKESDVVISVAPTSSAHGTPIAANLLPQFMAVQMQPQTEASNTSAAPATPRNSVTTYAAVPSIMRMPPIRRAPPAAPILSPTTAIAVPCPGGVAVLAAPAPTPVATP